MTPTEQEQIAAFFLDRHGTLVQENADRLADYEAQKGNEWRKRNSRNRRKRARKKVKS